jgi:hypothetical protein
MPFYRLGVTRDAFIEAFSIQRNLSCWRKCGAAPLTMSPLHSNEIRQQIPVGDAAAAAIASQEDEGITMLQSLEAMSVFYCGILDTMALS